jgi:hypothetical protein
MKIFIIVPLDFKFSTVSTVGQQFEKKVGLLSIIFDSLGHSVNRLFINADTAKLCINNRRKQLELLAEMLNRITDADEVFLVHRSDVDETPVWWPPVRDLLRGYGITVHESLDTLLGYKDTRVKVNKEGVNE